MTNVHHSPVVGVAMLVVSRATAFVFVLQLVGTVNQHMFQTSLGAGLKLVLVVGFEVLEHTCLEKAVVVEDLYSYNPYILSNVQQSLLVVVYLTTDPSDHSEAYSEQVVPVKQD